jgi:hypothetical protein
LESYFGGVFLRGAHGIWNAMNTIRAFLFFLLAYSATAWSVPMARPHPSTLKDKVAIKLGEEMTVQFRQEGNTLSEPKIVKELESPAAALKLRFSKKEGILMLSVESLMEKTMRYRALARLHGKTNYFETSVVPVMAGKFSFESWQDTLEELVLFDFRLTDEKF